MTSKLSVENLHELDQNILFYEENHQYKIIIDPDNNYTSVTTWIHSHFDKFDADKIIDKMMKAKTWNSKNKYFGMTKKQIKDQWTQNGKDVSSQGTLLHYYIEQFMNLNSLDNTTCSHTDLKEIFTTTKPFSDPIVDSVEWKYFMNYIEMFPHFVPYRTEWTIYDTELKIAGSIDMVYKNSDGTLMIYDWKRCKDITKSNIYNKYAITPCLDTVPDTNFWHYSLQLNIYKYILEKNYGVTVSKLYLVQLHPSSKNYNLIKVPDLSNTILLLVQDRLSKLKKN